MAFGRDNALPFGKSRVAFMPTNVSPEYKEAEARYRAAKSDEERLEALERMASTLNKHKGTEKLYSDIKRRIKQLREAEEKQSAKRGFALKVEREGAGQVVLVGPPNAGKSALLAAMTNAKPEVADYPFTTRAPMPGMMKFEDIGIQLVDLPPVPTPHAEGVIYGIIRVADAVVLVFDLSAVDPSGDIENTRALLLETAKVPLLKAGEAPPADQRMAAKPALLVGTRLDMPGTNDVLELLRDLYADFGVVGIGRGVEPGGEIPRAVYRMLRLVRVYAKSPGKPADKSKPFVLKQGSTLVDFAGRVHKDFVQRLAFARVWGDGKFDGQRVQRDYVLIDKDVVELHM
jgi:ribosome-interacting GTPase 1